MLGHPRTPTGDRGAGGTAQCRDLGPPSAGTFHAAGEAPPVGEDHQREVLPVEVPNSLGCFKGRVWEPDLPRLLDYLEETASSIAETSVSASRHTVLARQRHTVWGLEGDKLRAHMLNFTRI